MILDDENIFYSNKKDIKKHLTKVNSKLSQSGIDSVNDPFLSGSYKDIENNKIRNRNKMLSQQLINSKKNR